jgi:hypothetical protein
VRRYGCFFWLFFNDLGRVVLIIKYLPYDFLVPQADNTLSLLILSIESR